MGRLFEVLWDHERDRLAMTANAIVLEEMQPLTDIRVDGTSVRSICKPWRVEMREHNKHAARSFSRRAVNGSDAAARDGAAHDDAMRLARLVELGGVRGSAGDFLMAIDPADGLSNEC